MAQKYRIDKTPLLSIDGVYAKWESRNPFGSVKDRIAAAMLRAAEASGALQPGKTIIEATSGNTGIALAALAAANGYRCCIVMPGNASRERKQLLEAYGAEVILTAPERGMGGAIAEASRQAAERDWFYVNQFHNPANPLVHYQTTGPEIWQQTAGAVDMFIACVGTGGTLCGTGRYLKEQNPDIQLVAVTPAPGAQIPGIGAAVSLPYFDQHLIDYCFPVTAEQAVCSLRSLARTQGILIGPSSGAALFCAKHLAEQAENCGKCIVTLFPDSGERYLSTGLFS